MTNTLKEFIESYSDSIEGIEGSIKHSFSKIIYREMDKRDLTQKQLANLINGLTEGQLSKILNCNTNYTISSIAKILHVLDIKDVFIIELKR